MKLSKQIYKPITSLTVREFNWHTQSSFTFNWAREKREEITTGPSVCLQSMCFRVVMMRQQCVYGSPRERTHIIPTYTPWSQMLCIVHNTNISFSPIQAVHVGLRASSVYARWCFHFVSFHFSRISFVLLHICFFFVHSDRFMFYVFLFHRSLAPHSSLRSFCFLFGLPVHAIGRIGLVCVPLYLYCVMSFGICSARRYFDCDDDDDDKPTHSHR